MTARPRPGARRVLAPCREATTPDGYAYHTTGSWAAHDVASDGAMKTYGPSHGTPGQRVWPDGGTERRVYFARTEAGTDPFWSPDRGGHRVVLRVPVGRVPLCDEGRGLDLFSRRPVPAEAIEIRSASGWTPLRAWAARPNPRRPAGTPTRLNIDTLVATFGLADRVADGIAVTDLPHLRRCVAAGLVVVDPRGTLTLTPAGRSARDAHLAASPHILRPANDVRPNPGTKRRTPAILRHCVAKVAGTRGVSGAYAICTASLQRAGVMRGRKLTPAGHARDAQHRRRTAENRAKDTAFEGELRRERHGLLRLLQPPRPRRNGGGAAARVDGAYAEDTGTHTLFGVVHESPVDAFNDVADPFFESGYWDALGLDEDQSTEDDAHEVIFDAWRSFGGRQNDRVFAWHTLDVKRDARGMGLGRSIVGRIEEMLRKSGVKAVILQAGSLDDRHSLPFWERLGYKEWPLEYSIYEDRVMWKRL